MSDERCSADTNAAESMKIDFPDHIISKWQRTPWWLFWKPGWRRYHWRWTVDWRGCECVYAWQYAPRGFWPGVSDVALSRPNEGTSND